MYAEYYKGKIKEFTELAEYAKENKPRSEFYKSEAKQFKSRLELLEAEERKANKK